MSISEGGDGQSNLLAFLDVGHGDCCVFVNRTSKEALVVDAPDAPLALQFLLNHDVAEMPFVLATHLDSDHAKGIPQLVRNFCERGGKVRHLYYNPDRWGTSKGYRTLRRAFQKVCDDCDVDNSQFPVATPRAPLTLLDDGTVTAQVLYPLRKDLEDFQGAPNDTSVVLLVECAGSRILLTGDLEKNGCERLLDRDAVPRTDVLKMPHHGAWYPQVRSLLAAASPSYAVISCSTRGKGNVPAVKTLIDLARHFKHEPRVLCTQLTKHCHPSPQDITDRLSRSLPTPSRYGKAANGQGTPCGGTIYFCLLAQGQKVVPDPNARATAVQECRGKPVCRQPS